MSSLIELVWNKISERFRSIALAFKYFDTNQSQTLSFNELKIGLEKLGLSMTDKDVIQIFAYMDTDNNGLVSYNEFCELCEENRRRLNHYSLQD